MSYNKAIIVGNIGNDIEIRKLRSGDSVCELRVATNERKKGQDGEWETETEWHSVQVFGKSADNCAQYLRKGSKVMVEGKIKTRKWEGKDGMERRKTEISANYVEFLDTKEKTERSNGGYKPSSDMNSIPF